MAPYSVSTNTRYFVYLIIFVLSYFIHPWVVIWLRSWAGIPDALLGSLTAVAIIGFLVWIFDKFLWNVPFKLGFSFIPDFSGRWYGYIVRRRAYVPEAGSSDRYCEFQEAFKPVEMHIQQTFSSINVAFRSIEDDNQVTVFAQNTTAVSISSDDSRVHTLRYMFSRRSVSGQSSLEMHTSVEGAFLTGAYSSDYPRVGVLHLRKFNKQDGLMLCVAIDVLRSKSGAEYLGSLIDERYLTAFLRRLASKAGKKGAQVARSNQVARDGPFFHLTIVEPAELAALERSGSSDVIRSQAGRKVWIWLVDLGRQQRESDVCFFVIAESERLQELRKKAGLMPKDFHVTLGFDKNDIHDVSKGREARF